MTDNNNLTIVKIETRTPNSTYPKVAVQFSADTFDVNQSLVPRVNKPKIDTP
jgi:hypothetical protein